MDGIRILFVGLVLKKAFYKQSVRLLGILVGYFFFEMVYTPFQPDTIYMLEQSRCDLRLPYQHACIILANGVQHAFEAFELLQTQTAAGWNPVVDSGRITYHVS